MSYVKLQIHPKGLRKLFEAKTVATGMARTIPGGATLTVGGMGTYLPDAPLLVPVTLTMTPDSELKLLARWFHEELEYARVRYIRIKDMEVEVTAETIYKAICENIEFEDGLFVPADGGNQNSPTRQSLMTISEAEIMSSQAPIICLRVPPDMEHYAQGSAILKCSLCQSDVLAAPSTQAILVHGENQIICMECWTEAQAPELARQERERKLRQLEVCKQAGEQAYDDMYEKARHPSDATAYFSNAKESFYTAIGLARELSLDEEVQRLEARLADIKGVSRSQFRW